MPAAVPGAVAAPAAEAGARRRLLLDWVAPVVVFGLFLLFLLSVEDSSTARTIAFVVMWAFIGMSWNLIGGYAGQFSLGHAAFVGLGAYTSGLLQSELDVTPWLGLPAAAVVAALAGLLVGIPTLRLTGVYFSLATLAYPLILGVVFTYLGYQELLIPAKPDGEFAYMQFFDPRWYAVVMAVMVLLAWFAMTALERSRWRLVLRSVREDEEAAQSVGVNAARVKLVAFTVSAAVAGMGGVIYAQLLTVIAPPDVFGLNVSVEALLVALVGGLAWRLGPIIGAAILIPLTDYLDSNFASTAGLSLLVYGVILVVVAIVIPTGLLPAIAERWPRLRERLASRRGGGRFARPVDGSGEPVEERAATPPAPPARPAAERAPEPGATILEADGLTKAYGGVVAVREVSMEVRQGEFLGVVGPNGAGKTTLFDMLTGYQRPTEGAVRILGKDVTGHPPHQIARLGVRRTFQVPRPFGEMSVFENALLGTLRSANGNEDRDAANASARMALAAVGLGARAEAPAKSLVPAQVRLLEVARAVSAHPAVLLLDEPLAGLDEAEANDLMAVLRSQQAGGLTIVLVDHAIGTVAAHVERMFVIDNGHDICDGSPGDVMKEDRVVAAYLGSRWADAPR